jgi:hypothetical protein
MLVLSRKPGERIVIDDRITDVVDPTADPSDWDEALAEFLLKIVSKRHRADSPTREGEPIT